MSRLEKHRKRRAWLLWAPLAVIGCVIYAYSLGLTLTANGLSVIGLAVMGAGAVAALNETRKTWNS